MTTTTATDVENYERSVEIFGNRYGYTTKPLTMNGLTGVGVYAWSHRPDRGGVLEAWFLSHEHACRWVDVMIGSMS